MKADLSRRCTPPQATPVNWAQVPGSLWVRVWRGRPPHGGLLVLAALATMLAAIPVLYLVVRSATAGSQVWLSLLGNRVPSLLWSSAALAAAVTALAALIGVPLAFLVVRTDLPGRQWISWLGALPLVFPPYVGAFAYVTLLGPRGTLERLISRWTGVPGPELGLPSVYSLWGTTLVLALFTFPYIYLLTCAALRSFNQTLEDAARSAGLRPWQVFLEVTLPLLKPAIGAGALLVALYVLADFGAVAMLRYDTFTLAVFLQLRGRMDRSAAAALSVVLMVLAAFLLWAEERLESRGRVVQTDTSWRPGRPLALGRWRLPALAFVALVLGLALAVPAGMLAIWTWNGLNAGTTARLWTYAANSLTGSAAAATLGAVISFPLAYLAARHQSLASRIAYRLGYTGYGLPGVVVALACIYVFTTFLPQLYGTVWTLLTAYLIRYMPQSLGAQRAALLQISPTLEDAARSCGYAPPAVLARVTLPLSLPGILAGWSLVFLNCLKELPATLLLRPAGFDTLAVRVWIDASDGFYEAAGPAALALVLLGAVPLVLLLRWVLGGRVRLA